jgi:medium-chain acyl-[acyl-carrier-protein] hydrolase
MTGYHERADHQASFVSQDAWVVIPAPRNGALVRLIYFPNAGAGVSPCFRWTRHLPNTVELIGVRSPGRESRARERPLTSMEEIARLATRALAPYTDKPFAILGYSMGALVGYEVARQLKSDYGVAPYRFMAACSRAPHVPRRLATLSRLGDEQLLQELDRHGGMPPEIKASADTMKMILPIIRADFAAVETYQAGETTPLDVPIDAVGGSSDPIVTRDELLAWQAQTSNEFSLRIFDGGHFLIREHWTELLDMLVARGVAGTGMPSPP